jgi:type II restriction enzyme
MGKTQGQKLSENKNQHAQKNVESQQQDLKIKTIVSAVKEKIEEKYDIKLTFKDKILTKDIEALVSDEQFCKENTYIKPDGGFLYMTIDEKLYPILVSEQKRQGTNDTILLKGRKKQGKGNAVERLGKNVDAFDVLFGDEDIYPFVVFLQGCDFYSPESTIVDRVRTIANFQPMNVINLYWKQIRKNKNTAGSYFMRGHSMHEAPGTSDWTFDEMFNVMFEIADAATQYYIATYTQTKKES